MNKSRFLLPLLLGAGLGSRQAQAGAEWSKVLDEKDVKGYSREVKGSDILEFRSTAVIPARIELIGEIMRDVASLKRSSERCKEVRILEKKDRNNYTFYVAYDFPFPFDDRDVVIRVSTIYDLEHGRAVSNLLAVDSPLVPPRKGHVRIKDLKAQFVFEYLGRDKTGIIYTSRTDPGGHIPDFIVNYSNKKSLRSSAEDLRKATLDPRYRKAAARSPDTELVKQILADQGRLQRIMRNRLAEFIHDDEFVGMLAGDQAVLAAMVRGDGQLGETLLHGWGSRASRRQAVAELLRLYLGVHTRNSAAAAKLASDKDLLDRLLDGHAGGAASVRASLATPPGRRP